MQLMRLSGQRWRFLRAKMNEQGSKSTLVYEKSVFKICIGKKKIRLSMKSLCHNMYDIVRMMKLS